MQSRERKLDLQSIKNVYDNRPNVYDDSKQYEDEYLSNDAHDAALHQRNIFVDPSLLAEASEIMETFSSSPEREQQEQYANRIVSSDVRNNTSSNLMHHSFELGANNFKSNNSQASTKNASAKQFALSTCGSSETINRLINNVVEPNVTETLVSRFKPPSHSLASPVLIAGSQPRRINEQQWTNGVPIVDSCSSLVSPQRSPIPMGVNSRGLKKHQGMNETHQKVAPLTAPSDFFTIADGGPLVVQNHPQNTVGFSQQNSPKLQEPTDLETESRPPPMKSDPPKDVINIQERLYFYESQLEFYVGFIGIEIIFIYANFVFSNYAGAILSLFTLIAACYSHLDRRPASYLLTSIIMTIQILVLCIAVSVGIHGFLPYKEDPTLKAISIGAIPLGLIFTILNLFLAYQHSYSSEDLNLGNKVSCYTTC